MFRSRRFGGFFLFLLTTAQTACSGVSSEQPLSDPKSSEVDKRLFGQWKATDNRDEMNFIFGRPPENSIEDCPPGLILAYSFNRNANDEIHADARPAYLFVTKIGDETYINGVNGNDGKELQKWKADDLTRYSLMKYSVEAERLTIWLMNRDAAAKYVENGKLKGEVKRRQTKKDGPLDGEVDHVLLKDTTANLVKFLAGGGNRTLFSDKGKLVLNRVK
jgi:hypothetical protein